VPRGAGGMNSMGQMMAFLVVIIVGIVALGLVLHP
jgi:hypothetical protein